MIRIFGINLLGNKIIIVALTKIYGIGISTAKKICKFCNIKLFEKLRSLSEIKINNIINILNNFTLEGDLKREKMNNIKRLIDIKCYRGIRHLKKLPVRGQRTRTNARTRKGPRKLLYLKKINQLNDKKKY